MDETAYLNPEQRARRRIDAMLARAGWVVQDYRAVNLYAGVGMAVRELPTEAGRADYVLFVDAQAVGVVEAKRAGTTLSGVEPQTLHRQVLDQIHHGRGSLRSRIPYVPPRGVEPPGLREPASVLLERIAVDRASAPATTYRKAVTS